MPRLKRHFGKKEGQTLLYAVLVVAGWMAVNIMIVLGLPFAFFLAITGIDLELALLQLGNLTSRFAEADDARRASFEAILLTGFFGSLVAVALLRRHALRRPLRAARNAGETT